MDNNFQANRNYYLSALSYVNAATLLHDSYERSGLNDDGHMLRSIQMFPLYYLLALSGEMGLKAGLALNNFDLKELRKINKGHNLVWLRDSYNNCVSKIDVNLSWMLGLLAKGEFRYMEYFGEGAHLSVIPVRQYITLVQELIQKDQTAFLSAYENEGQHAANQ